MSQIPYYPKLSCRGGTKQNIWDCIMLTQDFCSEFKLTFQIQKCSIGTKPCLLFSGQEFENDVVYKRLKSILIGLFPPFFTELQS